MPKKPRKPPNLICECGHNVINHRFMPTPETDLLNWCYEIIDARPELGKDPFLAYCKCDNFKESFESIVRQVKDE